MIERLPLVLHDPEGEGIYCLDSLWEDAPVWPHSLARAARIFGCSYDDLASLHVWMRPVKDSDEWVRANIGRWPRGWRLNLPRRWRPVSYFYYTPVVEQHPLNNAIEEAA